MKRVKVYFLTILLSFVLALVFGWMISSIIVFFIVFLQVEDYGLTTQEKQIAYAGQVISIAIGCMGGGLLRVLLSLLWSFLLSLL